MFDITRFNGKGKVLQVLETQSLAMAKMFALTNTTGKGQTCISDSETGEVLYIVQGTGKDSFPKVFDTRDGQRKLVTRLV